MILTNPSQPGSEERSLSRTPVVTHCRDKILVLFSDLHQDEVCITGKVRDPQCLKASHNARAAYLYLFHVPIHIGVIGEGGGKAVKGNAVHVVRGNLLCADSP